jgi:hypothetical protein
MKANITVALDDKSTSMPRCGRFIWRMKKRSLGDTPYRDLGAMLDGSAKYAFRGISEARNRRLEARVGPSMRVS